MQWVKVLLPEVLPRHQYGIGAYCLEAILLRKGFEFLADNKLTMN